MAKGFYTVFLHAPGNGIGNDQEFCQGTVVAESEEEAMAEYVGDCTPLFAIPYAQIKAECPRGLGDYPDFGPYFAAQAIERGIPLSDYYVAKYAPLHVSAVTKPVGPRRPPPEVPPPIWDTRPINAACAMDVTRVLCGGTSREH